MLGTTLRQQPAITDQYYYRIMVVSDEAHVSVGTYPLYMRCIHIATYSFVCNMHTSQTHRNVFVCMPPAKITLSISRSNIFFVCILYKKVMQAADVADSHPLAGLRHRVRFVFKHFEMYYDLFSMV